MSSASLMKRVPVGNLLRSSLVITINASSSAIASQSERAVAAREAEAEDKVMDALAARIGERVMTKLSHMTDRIFDVRV
jgi:hypothetical protein